MRKNDLFEMEITGTTHEGFGVGKKEGMAVFVPGAAVGDRLLVRVLKVLSSYAYAKPEALVRPSASRVEPVCQVSGKCGGCAYMHIVYEEELRVKRNIVKDALERIGGLSAEVAEVLPCPKQYHYRNKEQLPFDARGRAGLFARASHRVIALPDGCAISDSYFRDAVRIVEAFISEYGITVYDESMGKGLVRHLYLRRAQATGQLMVCLVINGKALPHAGEFVKRLKALPGLTSVVLNRNTKDTNVVLSDDWQTLFGTGRIEDRLCGMRFLISPSAFYQVNSAQTERLYEKALDLARLDKNRTIADLFCGIGTITLLAAKRCGHAYGIELVPQAIEDARENAALNGIENATFICRDANSFAEALPRGVGIDTVFVDPPRKGMSPQGIEAVCAIAPESIVYISCNPATLARDVRLLTARGYVLAAPVYPVDMFPKTGHVECVVLMSKVQK
mgnify:CR=1 FL=1